MHVGTVWMRLAARTSFEHQGAQARYTGRSRSTTLARNGRGIAQGYTLKSEAVCS